MFLFACASLQLTEIYISDEDSYVGCVMDHASISNSFPPLFPCLSLDSCVEFGEPFLFLGKSGVATFSVVVW